MSPSIRDHHLHRKSGRSTKKARRIDGERPEDFTQPYRSRMPSTSSDDEISSRAFTSSAEKMQVERNDIQESYQSDDALGEGVEITEGGWICRVERFQKHVDSRGRIHLRHPRKEHSSPVRNQDLAAARKPEGLDPGQVEKSVQQSIISCVHHTAKSKKKDFIESETYIEIKSPLILEFLRNNTSYEQQV